MDIEIRDPGWCYRCGLPLDDHHERGTRLVHHAFPSPPDLWQAVSMDTAYLELSRRLGFLTTGSLTSALAKSWLA